MWLGFGTGVLLLVIGLFSVEAVIAAFHRTPEVAASAGTYLSISLWGLPAMLLVIAATGLLRGLQNVTAPLVVSGVGFACNAGLNAVLSSLRDCASLRRGSCGEDCESLG